MPEVDAREPDVQRQDTRTPNQILEELPAESPLRSALQDYFARCNIHTDLPLSAPQHQQGRVRLTLQSIMSLRARCTQGATAHLDTMPAVSGQWMSRIYFPEVMEIDRKMDPSSGTECLQAICARYHRNHIRWIVFKEPTQPQEVTPVVAYAVYSLRKTIRVLSMGATQSPEGVAGTDATLARLVHKLNPEKDYAIRNAISFTASRFQAQQDQPLQP